MYYWIWSSLYWDFGRSSYTSLTTYRKKYSQFLKTLKYNIWVCKNKRLLVARPLFVQSRCPACTYVIVFQFLKSYLYHQILGLVTNFYFMILPATTITCSNIVIDMVMLSPFNLLYHCFYGLFPWSKLIYTCIARSKPSSESCAFELLEAYDKYTARLHRKENWDDARNWGP
jgi:hypothetical protein